LVGDAGYHKDPFMATGIADAFRDADLLSDAIHQAFSGTTTLERALEDYEDRRNRAAADEFKENLRWATLEPPGPEIFQLRAALRGNQQQINRFTMARMGMIPSQEFFNPDNLATVLGRSEQTNAGIARGRVRH
jgi:flavin-dependent dehydrogenase